MAAEETVFSKASGYSSAAESTRPDSLLKRSSVPNGHYRTFDCPATSRSLHSSGGSIIPTLTSVASLDSPSLPQGRVSSTLGHTSEDSSDHERENSDEEDSLCETRGGARVHSYRRGYSVSRGSSGSASVQLLGAAGVGGRGEDVGLRGKVEDPDEEDAQLREDAAKMPPVSLACTLIPSWTVKHWKKCRLCYAAVILSLIFLILAILAICLFWTVTIIQYRSHITRQEDLSSSAVYKVSAEFPHANLYSNQLCLTVRSRPPPVPYDITKVADVTLASRDCEQVTMTTVEQVVSQDSKLGHNYMFFWLSGTHLSFHAIINVSSVMSVLLFDNKQPFDLCVNHFGSKDYVMAWRLYLGLGGNCGLVTQLGLMSCSFEYNITKSGYYYICMDNTIEYDLQYNLTISSVVYDIAPTTGAPLQCTPDVECCLPFRSIFEELRSPACLFVTTKPLDPAYMGIVLSDVEVRVDQRLAVVWYCVFCLVPLLTLLGCALLLCRMTGRKARDPDLFSRGCVLHCNIYSDANTVL